MKPAGSIETTGCRPDATAGIVALHEAYYRSAWGFGDAFVRKVEAELAEFLARFDDSRDYQCNLWADGRLAGSITLDVAGGGEDGAHLRWFVVDAAFHGHGFGERLLGSAMIHCDTVAAGRAWLTTFAGLDVARRLYERAGFRLLRESAVDQWSGGVREQLFVRTPQA